MFRIKRSLITFESPVDDSVWDSDDELVVPAGKQILSQICELLKQEGYQTTEIEQYESYGWTCRVTRNKQLVEFVFSGTGDSYYLCIDDTTNFITSWMGRRDYCDIPALSHSLLDLIEKNQLGTNAVLER